MTTSRTKTGLTLALTMSLLALMAKSKAAKPMVQPMAHPMIPGATRQRRQRLDATEHQGGASRTEPPKWGMSIRTPAEQEMYQALIELFMNARETLPLPETFWDDLQAVIRDGLMRYAEETTVLTNDDQLDVLRNGLGIFLDGFTPALVAELKRTTLTMLRKNQEDRAFGAARAERIVLNETRRMRTALIFMSDLIQRWESFA